MKPSIKLSFLLPASLLLVSWSPTDPVINNGTNNDTDGYSNGSISIHPFRGSVTGNNNVVGSATASNSFGKVLGNSNEANLHSSLLIGDLNDVSRNASASDLLTFTRFSGIYGTNNVIPDFCNNSLIAGTLNTVSAHHSIIAGNSNSVSGASSGSQAIYSAAIGNFNQISAHSAWVIGNTNTATATGSIAIGRGLSSSNISSTALGKWNAPMGTNDLLAVGHGTSETNRLTALTIQNDGSVIVPGAVSVGGNLDLQAATAQSITVTGNATLQGTTTAQNLTITGESTLQGAITATDIDATGTTTLAGLSATALAVSGSSTLAVTSATSLTTTGATDLAWTTAESLTVSGETVLNGTVTLAQAQGDISMGIYGN